MSKESRQQHPFPFGTKLAKYFLVERKTRLFQGVVWWYNPETRLYAITYEDGDVEEMDIAEVNFCVLLEKSREDLNILARLMTQTRAQMIVFMALSSP
jgi:hypothetical protein